ncbi:hypothetical protein COJ96_19055 [Bacillus sp. AFS073361]|uniref:hypothetical protein n=1 Tax=Bacillus sp. AFS073361 TaxID=2033511 RepID=UPI000BF2F6D4|nr:hypothetical protein [Bacillus sp. AFS073361]PFP25856.1 hypothetical protein COJ96_19055 [Bacillus sp. AFS073361]
MKFLLKTQILAIIIAIFWILYLNVVAIFDRPSPILQYLNWFVYGFAILFAIIYLLLTKYITGHKWLAIPLVILPYLMIYKLILEQILLSLVNKSYGITINFLSLSTGSTHLMAILIGLMFGVIISNRYNREQ